MGDGLHRMVFALWPAPKGLGIAESIDSALR